MEHGQVLGLEKANSTEFDTSTPDPVIISMPEVCICEELVLKKTPKPWPAFSILKISNPHAGLYNTHGMYYETWISKNIISKSSLYYFKAVCHGSLASTCSSINKYNHLINNKHKSLQCKKCGSMQRGPMCPLIHMKIFTTLDNRDANMLDEQVGLSVLVCHGLQWAYFMAFRASMCLICKAINLSG